MPAHWSPSQILASLCALTAACAAYHKLVIEPLLTRFA